LDALALQITHVQAEHTGNYTCRATNLAGNASHMDALVVHGNHTYTFAEFFCKIYV